MRAGNLVESWTADLRLATRSLRRPGTLWVAVATMAVAIGATTAVFGTVDRVLFRPLPYPNAQRLVWFGVRAPISPTEFLLEGSYWEFRERQNVFESMTALSRVGDCDVLERNPVRLTCAEVASTFLQTFGLRPIAGRDFTADDERPNSPRTAMLTFGLWQRRYGGDATAIGRGDKVEGQAGTNAGGLTRD